MREFKLLTGGKRENNGEKRIVFVLESEHCGAIIPSHFVFFFEAKKQRVFVHTEYMEYPSDMTLKELEGVALKRFVRCHRSFMVNMEYVKRYDENSKKLIMKEGTQIPVSKTYEGRVSELLKV